MKISCAFVLIAALPIAAFAADSLPLPKSVVIDRSIHVEDKLTLLQQLGAAGQ